MKDKESLHRKVQELVDCFATTDPLKEMSILKDEEAEEEAALKWLALAVLHGINAGAKEISVIKSGDGTVRVFAEYYKAELPSPGSIIGERLFESTRRITHLEKDKGETALAMGVREGSIDLGVEIEKERKGEKLKLKFPAGGEPQEKKKGETSAAESQAGAEGVEYCRFAADPEHGRAYREEEPCDDARAGDYEKRIGNEKKVR
jgi:hypothetical protein